MININGITNLYPIEASKNLSPSGKNLPTVSPTIFESIRKKSVREKFIPNSDILVPSTSLSPMLACLSTSENNLGIVFLDNANMQDKDNHLNNIDMTTNNIDMKITNLDLNKIDVQNANIDELKPTAPSPEVQIFNTWIPIDHHHYVIENETNEETNVPFINPANVVQVLNLYVSKFQPSENILDKEEDIAKKFIQNLTKSDFVDDRTKSELNDIITSPQSFNVI